jgi:uncharacterized repeat protein (TIGR01451 family)
LTVSPASQIVASGGTATWTISVTNSGTAYLYAVTISDPAAPSCGPPSGDSATLYFMAPNVTVNYTCALGGVTSSLTNTVTASATTAPGPVITQSASATVAVQAATPSAAFTPPSVRSQASAGTASARGTVAVTLSVNTVRVEGKKPKLLFVASLSSEAMLRLTLLNAHGHDVARWTRKANKGKNELALLLPENARNAGHDKLRLSWTGHSAPRTYEVTIGA